MFHHGIEDGEQFMHGGDAGDFAGCAGGTQALIEGANDGVVAAGDDGGHVEGGANGGAAAPSGAGARAGATIAIERGDADQGRELAMREVAEFRHVGEQSAGGGGADPRDGLEELVVDAPDRAGFDPRAEASVGAGDLLGQPADMRLEIRAEAGAGRGEAILFSRAHLDQLGPARHQGPQVRFGLGGEGARRGLHPGRHTRPARRHRAGRSWRGSRALWRNCAPGGD